MFILISDWLKAAQSFMTLALFGLLASIGIVFAYALVPDFDGNPKILAGCLAATGITSNFFFCLQLMYDSFECQ